MLIEMREIYTFAAAHSLPTFPDGHKCRRVHGHTWDVEITVRVNFNDDTGYAFDHADLDAVARDTIGVLDHQYLNDIAGLERGLSEDVLAYLVARIADRLESLHAKLVRVDLHEWSSGGALRKVCHTKTWNQDSR